MMLSSGLFVLLVIPIVFQWSAPAHMIIWDIAMIELGEDYIKNKIWPLIEPNNTSPRYYNIYEYACWADDAKNSTTAPWHFINIPYFINYSKPLPPLPLTDNVAWCINIAKDTLKGKPTGYGITEMLRFLVHCMGDGHQPLHVSDMYSSQFPDGDKGGIAFQ